MPNSSGRQILQGTYTGLVLYSKNPEWKQSHRLTGYNTPIKKFIIDKYSNIWITVPNTGIQRLKSDKGLIKIIEIKKYGPEKGLPFDSNSELDLFEDKVLVNVAGNHYYYDEKKDRFLNDSSLQAQKLPFLLRSGENGYRFKIYSDSFAVVFKGKVMKTYKFSLNKDYNSITEFDSGNFIFCLNEGYAVGNPGKPEKKDQIRPIEIDKIELVGSGKCLDISKNITEIPYSENNFRVYFHQACFKTGIYFIYTLKNVDKEWKVIKNVPFIEFSNIKHGNYTLLIKSSLNDELKEYKFKVLSPWYASKAAFLVYLIFLVSFLKLIKVYFDKKISKEKSRLASENETILKEHKYQLENDRLTQVNKHKSKELANATMHLIEKNELLQEIKNELIEVRKTGDHILTAKDFQNIMKLINDNLTAEEDKNLFESNFNDLHDSFLSKLKTEFPDLTSDDLKLSAYLKMNLSSKEIAPLFNISIRGLENKRYRLRKKIQLPNDINLTDFFINYS